MTDMNDFDHKVFWMAFNKIHNISVKKIFELLDTFGDFPDIIAAQEQELIDQGLLPGAVRKIRNFDLKKLNGFQQLINYLVDENFNVTTPSDEEYPALLKEIKRPPFVLYARGALSVPEKPFIAMSGSRDCSEKGRETAYRIGSALAEAGYSVVSGLALGIDAAAHQGVLDKGGITVAVLARGVDRADPEKNDHIYRDIIRFNGAVISEYPPGTRPSKTKYAQRDRIISGMAEYTVIVEGKQSSGTMITARHAQRESRKLIVIDWNSSDPHYGANQSLKNAANCMLIPVKNAAESIVKGLESGRWPEQPQKLFPEH